jgi:hypothetical protein
MPDVVRLRRFGSGGISVFLVMAAIGSALTAGHLEKPARPDAK